MLGALGDMARVWYPAVTALLIRRRRPIGEPAAVAEQAGAVATMAGFAGAGRIRLALAALGVEIGDLVQAVVDGDAAVTVLDGIDLGRRFETVVLGSHLVNLPDADVCRAWLRLASRHGDEIIVEHHPSDWAETAEATDATPGSEVGMQDVRRDPPFVSAVSTFDIGGRFVRQPFTARVLSDDELAAELRAVGLLVRRRLSPTFVLAAGRGVLG
jgi:hypothetical protein